MTNICSKISKLSKIDKLILCQAAKNCENDAYEKDPVYLALINARNGTLTMDHTATLMSEFGFSIKEILDLEKKK